MRITNTDFGIFHSVRSRLNCAAKFFVDGRTARRRTQARPGGCTTTYREFAMKFSKRQLVDVAYGRLEFTRLCPSSVVRKKSTRTLRGSLSYDSPLSFPRPFRDSELISKLLLWKNLTLNKASKVFKTAALGHLESSLGTCGGFGGKRQQNSIFWTIRCCVLVARSLRGVFLSKVPLPLLR